MNIKEFFNAVDIVCLNCHYTDENDCEKCLVRKTCDDIYNSDEYKKYSAEMKNKQVLISVGQIACLIHKKSLVQVQQNLIWLVTAIKTFAGHAVDRGSIPFSPVNFVGEQFNGRTTY